MIYENLPTYSINELNDSIGLILERGLPSLFILKATVTRSQLKSGHLWLGLSDGDSSIDGVIWASNLNKINFIPKLDDGVLLVGKINFWKKNTRLNINVINVKPSISTVLREFEKVKKTLSKEGLLDINKKRNLPTFPRSIGIFTSVPSSAYADILKTAKIQWPLTKLYVFHTPVQGQEAKKILLFNLRHLVIQYQSLNLDALVIARGGGSREDLVLFDDEEICREIAQCPIPVITGIGHEDDITVIDLVADLRAATPTAAIFKVLPSKDNQLINLTDKKSKLDYFLNNLIKYKRKILSDKTSFIKLYEPRKKYKYYKSELNQRRTLLRALSPNQLLRRGYCYVKNSDNEIIKNVKDINLKSNLKIIFQDGSIDTVVTKIIPED